MVGCIVWTEGNFLEPKELDVVRLNDGREVVILEVFDSGAAFYVECPDSTTGDSDFFVVALAQIKTIIWHA